MIIGRNSELNQLGNYYDRDKSQILVLYGQKYIGKTALIREFMSDKPGFYYACEPASEREQKYRLGLRLAELGIKTLKYPELSEVFACLGKKHTQKKVIVFDEFQHILKSNPDFFEEIISFIHSNWNNQEYLVILSSSSVGFVENSLVSRIGDAAFELSGFLKLKELSFYDLRDYFSLYTNEDCAVCYSILGGVPGLWKMFDEHLSIKDNIVKNLLAENGALHNVARALVTEELRETSVYNTILSALAVGKNKLNDLYEHTEFSRAKISVYIKNLMELELVEKLFSVDTEGRDNSQKGLYGISNNLVDFYYSFMFNRASYLETSSPEEFYRLCVVPGLKAYVDKHFDKICLEYLSRLNDKKKLPINVERFGKWIGKQGNIDIMGKSADKNYIICLCAYDKAMVTYDDYELLLYLADNAKISADHIYLFAGNRFDEKLSLEAKVRKNLRLLLLDNL